MSEILFSTHEGTLMIGDYEVRCAVLNNGKRVVFQREVVGLLTGNKKGGLDRYLKPDNLQPYKPPKFQSITIDSDRIPFKTFNKKDAQGFEGPDIIDFLDMYLKARDANALLPNQLHLAEKAEKIIRSVAKVGIIALIDEATGYQDERIKVKDELRTFLDRFLRQDKYAGWTKRFPDEFYKHIYRLKGWDWSTTQRQGNKKVYYSIVHRYTNDIIYKRLGPAVLEELERLNPIQISGSRKVKHHQWLSDDLGHPQLTQHFNGVNALMRASTSWDHFMRQINRAYPKPEGYQEYLFD